MNKQPIIVEILAIVFLTIISMLLFSVISLGINQIIYGSLVETSRTAMGLMQTLIEIGTFLVPAVLFAFFFYKPVGKFFLLQKPVKSSLWKSLAVMILTIPVVSALQWMNEQIIFPDALADVEAYFKSLEEAAARATEQFLNVHAFSGLLGNLFVMALVAAVTEEFFFRGLIQQCLIRWTKQRVHLSVWMAAFIFSAVHFQFYGFLPRMFLGGMLGYMFVYSKSLWVPIAAHFLNNSLAVITDFLHRNYYLFENWPDFLQP